jgi:predicted nucleic acid-binding protein
LKIVADTSIYIDFFNRGNYEDILLHNGYFKYLAPIVLTELLLGCDTPQDRKVIENLRYISEKMGRIILYSPEDYMIAGSTLNTLRIKKGYDIKKTHTLANDVFIAVAARKIGAILFTKDKKDFETINEVMTFRLEIVT